MAAQQAELDTVVIGAGVVGLAIARHLAMAGQTVAVLEQEPAPGQHTSSRNSEIIHAGFYYPTNSHKASLCVRGKQLLYDYCGERHIPHRQCGKLLLAHKEQDITRLSRLMAQGKSNGVHDLELWDQDMLRRSEPQLSGCGALLSPSTGIVDAHGLLQALETDLLNAAGLLVCHSTVNRAGYNEGVFEVHYQDEDGAHTLHCEQLINAAGLFASQLAARLPGADNALIPATRFAKGNYYNLHGQPPSDRLIYPLPDQHGLGIHLTLDLQGLARFGPDVDWVDDIDYRANPERHALFVEAVQRYWPALDPRRLTPAWAGIRPKACRGDQPLNDFVLLGPEDLHVPGLVQLFGIESPGLTACLALAERVALMLARNASPDSEARPLH